jgi:hypothetical protein
MDKYKIEGNIDFYTELYKSLDNDDNINDDNLCLITNQPLIDNYVQLQCGHKFNYEPLYNDIKNHKQKFNGMERSNCRLSHNEIRCPYCRNKHNGVLPYYDNMKFKKINGVNWYVSTLDKNGSSGCYEVCCYLTQNPNYDPSGNSLLESNKTNVGNVKNFICNMYGSKIVSENDLKYAGTTLDNEKCYCYKHKQIIIKEYKKEVAVKAKEEAKKAKELAKAEQKKAKDLEKEEAKKVKKEATKATKVKDTNVVLGVIKITNEINTGCVELLKSGINKGKPCGCKISNNNLCTRHLKIKEKQNN